MVTGGDGVGRGGDVGGDDGGVGAVGDGGDDTGGVVVMGGTVVTRW